MRPFKVLAAILAVSLTACATYPQSREAQAAYYADQAKGAFSKGNYQNAVDSMDVSLTRPTGDVRVREVLLTYPQLREHYIAFLSKRISDISVPYNSISAHDKIDIALSARVLSEAQSESLYAQLKKTVADGNRTGAIPFTLSDNIDKFPELRSPEHQRLIVDRTIAQLKDNAGSRSVSALMDYVQLTGVNTVEGQRVESLMPTLNIRRNELEDIAKVFPAFAAARADAITTRAVLQIKNADRLFADDLLQALRAKVRGVEWVSNAGPKIANISVERVRQEERILPERAQSVTYAQHEVNLLSAALLMPRNASYIYEAVSGGASIEYGYVISAVENGAKVYEQVVRGKVDNEYRRCENARIQNVFGCVTSAGFVANDDMQRRCSGPTSSSVDSLRNEVLGKIIDGVLRMPRIAAAHELN